MLILPSNNHEKQYPKLSTIDNKNTHTHTQNKFLRPKPQTTPSHATLESGLRREKQRYHSLSHLYTMAPSALSHHMAHGDSLVETHAADMTLFAYKSSDAGINKLLLKTSTTIYSPFILL